MARRILVAVDSRDTGTRLLDVAARIAAARRAELIGLYVEESAFLNLADLPFSKAMRPQGGGWERLDPAQMERAFRARAEELNRELASLAGRHRLTWRFQTERGAPAECLMAAAGGAELVILGRGRRGRRAPLGSTARRAVRESSASVLVMGAEAAGPARVTAFYDGDPGVLEAADELARLYARPLEVAVLARDAAQRGNLDETATQWLRRHERPRRLRTLDAGDPDKVAAALREAGPGLAVVGATSEVGGTDLAAFMDRLDCPVLVVR